MPSIEKGESEDDYVKRCIPIKVSEGMSSDQAVAACHGMYKQHKEKGTQYEKEGELKEYTFECSLKVVDMSAQLTSSTLADSKPVTQKEGWVTLKAVAVVGDRMMKNVFVPYEALKKSIDMWNGTYHDLNHMGTSYPDTSFPFKRQNIDYIVGYQSNAVADDQTKEIQMDVNINKNAPKYASWKSFVDINHEANKIPNVSMSIVARSKRVKAKDLNFDATSFGFAPDDMVDCLYDIYPKALTTCIEGECNSSKGCGLAKNHEVEAEAECKDCKCGGKCKIVEQPLTDGVSEEDAKKIALIKNRINKLKEEKNNE